MLIVISHNRCFVQLFGAGSCNADILAGSCAYSSCFLMFVLTAYSWWIPCLVHCPVTSFEYFFWNILLLSFVTSTIPRLPFLLFDFLICVGNTKFCINIDWSNNLILCLDSFFWTFRTQGTLKMGTKIRRWVPHLHFVNSVKWINDLPARLHNSVNFNKPRWSRLIAAQAGKAGIVRVQAVLRGDYEKMAPFVRTLEMSVMENGEKGILYGVIGSIMGFIVTLAIFLLCGCCNAKKKGDAEKQPVGNEDDKQSVSFFVFHAKLESQCVFQAPGPILSDPSCKHSFIISKTSSSISHQTSPSLPTVKAFE